MFAMEDELPVVGVLGGALGLLAIPILAVFYGVFGAVFVSIGGLLYNVAAGFVGGVRLETRVGENLEELQPRAGGAVLE